MAASHHGGKVYDLLIVTDITHSMTAFLRSLHRSLQDIIRISAITDCFSRIGVLGYSDHIKDNPSVTKWSGWYSRDPESEVSQDALLSFVAKLKTCSGHDWPEATKTALAHAYQLMRTDATTIILLYADAPPHIKGSRGLWQAEQDALNEPGAYGGSAKLFADWTSAARSLAPGNPQRKEAQVFSIIESATNFAVESRALYTYLSTLTGGVCIVLERYPSSTAISKLTVGLLLAWMGVDKQGSQPDRQRLATHWHFVDTSGIHEITSETDASAVRYLPAVWRDAHELLRLAINLASSPLTLETMAAIIPRREEPVLDFAARYKADPSYRELVTAQLADIIEADVAALSLNPVFGTLWRTVCNDRLNPARTTLISRFGFHVDRIYDLKEKARLKEWLEESYDWTGEILAAVQAVPAEARYPCVFLDPTSRSGGDNDGPVELTRSALLEIGRSCDNRILRRLGRILTRLTYVNSPDELPAHISSTPEDKVPRIPMALAAPEYDRKFWKILLHLVLPGTMLAPRPAALLAALSLRMGIKPLEQSACTELLAWRGEWNTLKIPETWSINCLSLLLEADHKQRQLMAGSQTQAADAQTILKAEDRRLFQTLVDYKLLEMNLDTTLTAEVGWTPAKSTIPMGPVVSCKTCRFPRSVTIMAEGGMCGLCAFVKSSCHDLSEEECDACVRTRVSMADNSATEATWAECSVAECRAQYVIYDPVKLRVRPKCHYCRQKATVSRHDPKYQTLASAPCVTCTQCLNRVIWPDEYRPSDFDPAAYNCPACANNHATIVEREVTPRALAAENGTVWLLRNDDNAIARLFSNRSIFHIVSALTPAQLASLPDKVSVLPHATGTASKPIRLTLRGKPILNASSLLAALAEWVSSRRVQAGTCTLCFSSNLPKHALRPACGGRRGCDQPICGDCARAWYGRNARGRLLDLAALACPFCRRPPTPRAALPRGLRYLAGLRDAVAERGTWVYAWCAGCGCARRFAERDCARGAPAEVEGWRCEECAAAAAQVAPGEVVVVVKECPGCGVATEKVAGCDHIACRCGTHWCFNCEKAVGVREIYRHMSEEHGGWYNGEGYEGEDFAAEDDW